MAKIGKLEIVRRELDAAVRMVLDGYDPIPVHNVVSAATQIIEDISKSRGIPTMMEKWLKSEIKAEHVGTVRALFRKAGNAIKHADKDVNAEIEELPPEHNDVSLVMAIVGYRTLADQTGPMALFIHWWEGMRPELLLPSPVVPIALAMNKVLKDAPRDAQLSFGRVLQASVSGGVDEVQKEEAYLSREHPEVYSRYRQFRDHAPALYRMIPQLIAQSRPSASS